MERRLLLVFALTFLVIILFQPLLKNICRSQPLLRPRPRRRSSLPAPVAATAALPSTLPAGAGKQAAAESETVVENDLYRVTFTNRGGLVKSWILKTYYDEHGNPLELVSKAAESLRISDVALDLRRGPAQ